MQTHRTSLKKPPPPKKGTIAINNETPSFGSQIMSGIALGTGSSLGHRAVDMIMGPKHTETANPMRNHVNQDIEFCKVLKQQYEKCIQKSLVKCDDLDDLIIKYNCE